MSPAVLFIALAFHTTCQASTQKPYNPCHCRSLAKYDTGVIYDRVDCCANWTAREPVEPIVQVAGVVYRFNRNQSRYYQYSSFFMNQVDYPGEENVLYDPNNMYTNYTCKDFSCRRAVVFRNVLNCSGSRYDNGDCVDYGAKPNPSPMDPPLCHNSTVSKCIIWVPIPKSALGGDALLSGTIAAISVLSGLVLLTMIYSTLQKKTSCIELTLMVMLLVYLMTLSLLTSIAVWRFDKWMALTEVNLDYATYQTCMIECAVAADLDSSLAQTNQCEDTGISCSGAPSAGNPISCRGCSKHGVDWMYIVAYNDFIKTAIIVQWVILTVYSAFMGSGRTKNHGALFCVLLPFAVLVIMCGVLNARVTIFGAHGLTQYSSLTNTPLIADLGIAWTVCGAVWLFMYIVGKAVDVSEEMERQGHDASSAAFVFCG